MDAQELRNLQEAYSEVYQELDEAGRLHSASDQQASWYAQKYGNKSKPRSDKEIASQPGGQAFLDKIKATKEKMSKMKEEVDNSDVDEAYKPIGKDQQNRMYRRAGNLARTSIASDDPKEKVATAKKSAKIVRAITRQSERERFDEIGKSPAHNEEVDLFDYMLEYLVAEGYADTNKAAINIMANMSEEWRDSIIDEAYQEPRFGKKDYIKKLSKRGGMGMGTPEDPHGYRDPKMAKVGAEFSKRKTAAVKAKQTGQPDTYKAEKQAQSKMP